MSSLPQVWCAVIFGTPDITHPLSTPCSPEHDTLCRGKHCPIALIPGIRAVSTGEMLTYGISLGTRWDQDSGHNREKANGKKKGVRWRFQRGDMASEIQKNQSKSTND